jgi:hypothetical protein
LTGARKTVKKKGCLNLMTAPLFLLNDEDLEVLLKILLEKATLRHTIKIPNSGPRVSPQ